MAATAIRSARPSSPLGIASEAPIGLLDGPESDEPLLSTCLGMADHAYSATVPSKNP